MVFNKFGQFIPDTLSQEQIHSQINTQPQSTSQLSNARQLGNINTIPSPSNYNLSPAFINANALRQNSPNTLNQPLAQTPLAPIGINPSSNNLVTRQGFIPSFPVAAQTSPNNQMSQNYSGYNYFGGNGYPIIPMQQNRNLEQMVNSGDPQSVQNFMSALNKVGAGSNNTFMNAPNAQGQGPQGGFQGFSVNGQPLNGIKAATWSPNSNNSQLGYTNNGANFNQNIFSNTQATQGKYTTGNEPIVAQGQGKSGGTGGINGQPEWNGGFTPSGYPQAGGVSAFSDENAKKNIKSGESELKDFLDNLGIYSYEYKNPEHGEGRRISPMAQEIEKTPLGANAISTNHEGYKMVDYGKLAGVQLASLALLNKKYNEINQKVELALNEKFSKKGK